MLSLNRLLSIASLQSHVVIFLCRSRLAIIPQDAFLFSGGVRNNLDPWRKVKSLKILCQKYEGQQAILSSIFQYFVCDK